MRSRPVIALAVLFASFAADARAQGVSDPAVARAVLKCQKAITKAERTFAATLFGDLKTCVESVFACVQLKPGDGACDTKAATTCDKQFLRSGQAAVKLRAAIGKACGAAAIPYDVLQGAAGLDVDAFAPTCVPFGVPQLETLEHYVECVFRIASCGVEDQLEAGAPRADALLASVGRDLRDDFCPMPAPTATAGTRTPTPTPTATVLVPTATATATLTATPTPFVTATSLTPTPTVSATTPATTTPTVTPTPLPTSTPGTFNIAFVTSTTHSGSFGGLAGADAICATLASNAGLPGTYVAWLSTATVNAIDRLGSARGFVRPDGAPFTDQPAELAANQVFNALHLDETGTDVGPVEVWTGTQKNGTAAANACTDWTATTGKGRVGNSQGGPAAWTDAAADVSCSQPRRHYCFGTSLSANAVSPTIATGKIAFITNGTLDPSTGDGLTSADTMCGNEAAGALLPGTYKALLATSAASAISRIAVAAQYVRPDGTLIADGATLASGGTLTSGIWQRPTGVYLASLSDVAWTGASTPSTVGDASSTCGDFASASGAGFFGRATLSDPTWWHDTTTPSTCSTPHHVYCLEQ